MTEGLDNSLPVILVNVRNVDKRALGNEGPCDSFTNSTRSARDKSYFSFKTHRIYPPMSNTGSCRLAQHTQHGKLYLPRRC